LEIRNSGSPRLASGVPSADTQRFLRETCEAGVRYVAGGIGEFVIHSGGTRITYSLAPGAPAGDVQHILTGPALVMALQLQGEFFLHAGAIEHAGTMFALSAPHGFGKSTLTASFFESGCKVHSDDVVPIRFRDGQAFGGQGQPWIKLWDNVLNEFGKDPQAYDEVLDGLGKRIVPGLSGEGELPLRCVYLLAPHMSPERGIEFHRLTALEGALSLMRNVYSPEIIEGELARKTLDFATRIAESVAVRAISYYRSFENLPAIRQAILSDFEEVSRG